MNYLGMFKIQKNPRVTKVAAAFQVKNNTLAEV